MGLKHALVLVFFAVCGSAAVGDPAPPDAVETVYRSAMKAMDNLPQPAYVSYTMRGEDHGLAVTLTVVNHLVWLDIHNGSEPAEWKIRHRTDDYASELIQENGIRYVSKRPFFDPTWYGGYHALRDTMLGYQKPETPLSGRASPPPETASTIREIGVINIMGPTIYRLQDRGPLACPSGSAGHAVHLIPKDRDPRHQLSDVTIDDRTQRICLIRFGIRDSFGFHGVVEQHYGNVGGYWMQTDGFLDGTLRVFGIATHHGKWIYRLEDMTFPRSIPADAFTVPFTQ